MARKLNAVNAFSCPVNRYMEFLLKQTLNLFRIRINEFRADMVLGLGNDLPGRHHQGLQIVFTISPAMLQK